MRGDLLPGKARALWTAPENEVRLCAFQMPCTVETARPAALAIARAVQCVASCGGGFSVIETTFAARSSGTGGLPGGRVLSRSRPSTPSAMNRSCQRQTVVFAVPVAAMMAFVPTPSAVGSTIRQRQTCFCDVLWSVAMDSRRRRSASSIVMVILVRMLPTRMRKAERESPLGTLLSRSNL